MRKSDLCLLLSISLLFIFASYMVACQTTSNIIGSTPSDTNDASRPPDTKDSSPPTVDSNRELTIEAIKVSDVTESSARISWRTNVKTVSQVEYGKSSEYGSRMPPDSYLYTLSSTVAHDVILKGLDANTNYHFRIKSSEDAAGSEYVLDVDYTFRTLPLIGCQVGNRPPDFTLKNLDGGDVTLSNFFGKRILIFFWADD